MISVMVLLFTMQNKMKDNNEELIQSDPSKPKGKEMYTLTEFFYGMHTQ